MAQIAPFAAIHYAPNRVPLDLVIAPPYDVLSPAQQGAYYARHPDNIARLMLNKETPEDTSDNNRYTRANAFLHDTLERGVMVRDDTPGLYEYVQRFEHPLDPTQIVERTTLFVALKLEPYANGVVLPHEETHPKAKADRLELMRATHTNPEPIYGLYADPEQTVAQKLRQSRGATPPLLQANLPGKTGPDMEQHIIYRHTAPALLSELEAFFAPHRVWIADGHHRYETALNYQKEEEEKRRKGEKETEEAQSAIHNPQLAMASSLIPHPSSLILIGLSAFEDPGMVVLPTHRLVKNISPARLEDLPLQLERYFHLHFMSIPDMRTWIKQQVEGEKRFGIVLPDKTYGLILRDMAQAEAAMDASHCLAWKHLDVTILQTLVLDRCLGISWQELAHTPDVAYTRDEEEAVQKVQSGEFQLACLLQNPTVTEVRDVASEGDKMPQKSTFFYPKLYSGLIVRSLE